MTVAETPARAFGGSSLRGSRYLLPLVVGAIQVIGTHAAGNRQPERVELDVVGLLLVAIGPAALILRHRHPVAVLWFVLLTTQGYLLLDYPRGPVFLSLIAALVTAVLAGHRAAAVTSLVVGYPSFLWLPYLAGIEPPPSLAAAVALAAWLLLLLSGSEVARSRRERAMELERTRAEETKRRASEERLRIARELHDVLAHNISLINVQASVALHVTEELPEQARDALTAIKDASVEALGELQSVLEVLREGHEAPPRAPASGLARLDDLVAKTEAAGLTVTTRIQGTPRRLPSGVDLAAFRIVQEALTNVTRHAGDANAEITIGYGKHDLTVRIDDDGTGTATKTSSGGRGIAGMRERATALDGEFDAGPLPGKGFRVQARLPLQRDGSDENP